ncbi:MAG: hypothetical protein ACP5N2_00750 [Candidatus Nanoarchaeia archaeon]
MQFKRTQTKSQDLIYADLDIGSELKYLNGLDLTDSELEFIQLKRTRNKRHFTPLESAAPDPRLGDYEA